MSGMLHSLHKAHTSHSPAFVMHRADSQVIVMGQSSANRGTHMVLRLRLEALNLHVSHSIIYLLKAKAV